MVLMFLHKVFNKYLSQVIDMSCSLLVVESVNTISWAKKEKFGWFSFDGWVPLPLQFSKAP